MGEFRGVKLGNANFRNLDLESGMGSADLDLSGDWRQPEAEMTLEVGMGSVKVEIPEKIGVEVYNEDSFLASVRLDREIREVSEGVHRTDNWEDADHRVSINAEVGLGSVRIKVVD
jgi:predicted membrane protein